MAHIIICYFITICRAKLKKMNNNNNNNRRPKSMKTDICS